MLFANLFKVARGTKSSARSSVDAEALESLAQTLLDEGIGLWLNDQHNVVEAIVKVEQSWALKRTPDTAIRLGDLYDRVNRHQDSLSVYRQAFNLFPDHPRLRHEAGITLLRHGHPDDVKTFFRSLRQLAPDDTFARFVGEMLDLYPSWVTDLIEAVRADKSGKEVYILSCAIWGEPFATSFLKYLCASLLASNNIPALVRDHSIHFSIFTSPALEARMRADPIFQQLLSHISVHFVHYDPAWLCYADSMQRHYGPELAPYYSRTCKFLLFSCAHYVALAAGREVNCNVIPLCADVAYSNGAFMEIARLMRQDADIVAYWNFDLEGAAAQQIIEDSFRKEHGRLVIPVEAFPRLLIEHMSRKYEEYFVDSQHFSSFPLHLFWRVGPNAILVHATHYHPLCIRPSALSPPFELTIDPIDSRFLDKRFADESRVHFVRDLSIASFTLEDEASQDPGFEGLRTMSVRDVGLWLWGFWGRWRATTFLSPICVADGELPPEWEITRGQAGAVTSAIVREAERLEEGSRRYKSWVVAADRGEQPDRHPPTASVSCLRRP